MLVDGLFLLFVGEGWRGSEGELSRFSPRRILLETFSQMTKSEDTRIDRMSMASFHPTLYLALLLTPA